MEQRDYATHLRPVPDSGDTAGPEADDALTKEAASEQPSAPEKGAPEEEIIGREISPLERSGEEADPEPDPRSFEEVSGEEVEEIDRTLGITEPKSRVHSAAFVTDVLVELGYVNEEVVKQAIDSARTAGRPPERLLLEQGAINPDQLSRAVAERYGLDHVDLSAYKVDMAAANLIPVTTARRYNAIPVGFVDKETLLVAMADPTNLIAVDDIKIATGLDCRAAVAPEEDIEALMGRLNTLQSAVSEAIVEGEEQQDEDADLLEGEPDTEVGADDAPVVKLVYSILGQAIGEGASDVHFEADEGEMRVRFRVDGVLREAAHVPRRMITAVISRVKIMSDLNIAEKRVPQDGRVSVTVEEHRVDLRVTTLPTQKGEGATIRILDKENANRTLDDLGMDGHARERFQEAFTQAYGAVLVTGPTGSGKSTTLYSALKELNQVEKNIITIEDPVEYQLQGVNQINVNRKAGLDFATGLRSMLRADPDIVMVGEIRDGETARVAIEAALTGHMLLSTLHTNDAPGAITRLTKMGIEAFLISSAVDCVVAQRLSRKLCSHCKKRVMIPPQAMEEAGIRVGVEVEAYEPVGCARCSHNGYRGRVGIYSVMVLSEKIKEMVVSGASEAEINQVARDEGMRTLREDGFSKVRAGQTSLEEVIRVTA
ncbi:MAG TPA: ATPase, T2SS/T4P/T4SS family [Solirubrobacterales bacterium]